MGMASTYKESWREKRKRLQAEMEALKYPLAPDAITAALLVTLFRKQNRPCSFTSELKAEGATASPQSVRRRRCGSNTTAKYVLSMLMTVLMSSACLVEVPPSRHDAVGGRGWRSRAPAPKACGDGEMGVMPPRTMC